ncbi:MAG: hypothetical protein FJ083_13905 [Cyanobacteria bacterium K_Offshore_surface_m2_239]|nr:hypothetical protein [Cyanobacteria bacterium K_Offshore_surface_m2_239]
MPVTLEGGGVTIETVPVPTSVTVGNTPANPVPMSDAGGSLTVDDGGGSLTVDGPVTDDQMRASPLAVTGPLTNSQLRETPLPVLGPLTNNQLRETPLPVSGPLTNNQLRETPLPVSFPQRIPAVTSVPSSVSPTLLLAQNPSRKGLLLNNKSTSKLLVAFSSLINDTNSFILEPGSLLMFDQQLIFSNAIYGAWTSANGTLTIVEFT